MQVRLANIRIGIENNLMILLIIPFFFLLLKSSLFVGRNICKDSLEILGQFLLLFIARRSPLEIVIN